MFRRCYTSFVPHDYSERIPFCFASVLATGRRLFYRQIGDGAFITRDTYLDQKPYLYCEHDPVNAVDPSGHFLYGGLVLFIFIVDVIGGLCIGTVTIPCAPVIIIADGI